MDNATHTPNVIHGLCGPAFFLGALSLSRLMSQSLPRALLSAHDLPACFAFSNPHFSSPMRNALAEAVVQMGFFICTPGVVFCALLKRGRKTLDATPCVQSGFLIDSPNR